MPSKIQHSTENSIPLKISERVSPNIPLKQNRETFSRLIEGDNLEVLRSLINERPAPKAKLIYMDPPFLSKALYHQKITIDDVTLKMPAYSDKWTTQGEYLDMIYSRVTLARELLVDDGLLFAHCDWRASAHIRLLLDEVFGVENFLNEIIWHYGGRGAKATSGQFPRNHDTIFVYGKTKKARLKKIYKEEVLSIDDALAKGYKMDDDGRVFKTAPRGDYTDASIKKLDKEGRIYNTKTGKVRVKYFLERTGRNKVIEKKLIGDVWTDIPDLMHSPIKERTDYATQKPALLLERIIECSTNEDDLVVDLFSGSGTTPLAAERMNRRSIAIDKNPAAIRLARARLMEAGASLFTIESTVKRSSSKKTLPKLTIKKPLIKELKGKGISITVELTGYTPTKDTLIKTREIIGNSKSTSIQILDYWTIDWNYDGENFNALWSSSRGFGKAASTVNLLAKAELQRRPHRIAIRAVDIFGGQTGVVILEL